MLHERHQVACQAAPVANRALQTVQRRLPGVLAGGFAGQGRIAGHRAQHVVDVMGHRPGQLAQDLEFLRAQELGLGPAARIHFFQQRGLLFAQPLDQQHPRSDGEAEQQHGAQQRDHLALGQAQRLLEHPAVIGVVEAANRVAQRQELGGIHRAGDELEGGFTPSRGLQCERLLLHATQCVECVHCRSEHVIVRPGVSPQFLDLAAQALFGLRVPRQPLRLARGHRQLGGTLDLGLEAQHRIVRMRGLGMRLAQLPNGDGRIDGVPGKPGQHRHRSQHGRGQPAPDGCVAP